MLRAIREIQPTWVVGENVRGLTNWNGGMVFDEVQADLEAQGYEVTPFLLPACAVNAPHRRDRIWFVAHSIKHGRTDFNRNMGGKEREKQAKGNDKLERISNICKDGTTTNPDLSTTGPSGESGGIEGNRSNGHLQPEQRGEQAELNNRLHELSRDVADTNNKRLEGLFSESGEVERTIRKERKPWSGINGGIPDWQDFPTQSPICTRNDGISSRLDGITFPKWRNESIKGGGNAIVPQVALQIFKAIEKYENKS
jgi:DNA (cytosine-5)-methyltransferase 1